MKTHLKKISIVSYFLSIVILILAGVIVAKGAWNPPTGTAPTNNTPEPINVGLGSVPAQLIQNGALGINGSLDVVSNAFFENKVGIGIKTYESDKMTGALNVVGNASITNGNLSVDPDYGITVGNVLIANQTLNSSVSNFQARTFSGGTLVAGSTYYYKITAKVSGNFISSVVSSPCFIGSGDNACKLSWESLPGASVYVIYGRPSVSDGTFNFIACIPSNTNIYTDTGIAGSNTCSAGSNPPSGVITKISGIGAMSMSGALGIGIATPTDTMLEVSNSISDNILKLSRLGANSTIFKIGGSDSSFAVQSGGPFKILNSSGADKFVVQQNGNTAITGDLSMTGSLTGGTVPWARLTDVPAATTYDVIADGGLKKDGNNFGLMTSGCSDGQVLKFDGSDWSCQNDAGGITGGGADNNLAKWKYGHLTNSVIYDTDTNIGIGTNDPGKYKLKVSGGGINGPSIDIVTATTNDLTVSNNISVNSGVITLRPGTADTSKVRKPGDTTWSSYPDGNAWNYSSTQADSCGSNNSDTDGNGITEANVDSVVCTGYNAVSPCYDRAKVIVGGVDNGTATRQIQCVATNGVYSIKNDGADSNKLKFINGSNSSVFTIDQSGMAAIGGAVDSSFKLRVYGDVKANQFSTGDLLFNHNGRVVWRMYEDEQGLYVQSPITGKRYRMMMEEIKE